MLRAAEIGADVILLAKNIDGVYNADPAKSTRVPSSTTHLATTDVLAQHLGGHGLHGNVAFHGQPYPRAASSRLRTPKTFIRAVKGEKIGTIVAK